MFGLRKRGEIDMLTGMQYDSFGIDTSNLIHTMNISDGTSGTYTPSQDCWAVGAINSGTSGAQAYITLNGTKIIMANTFLNISGEYYGVQVPICFPVKAGQVLATRARANQTYYIEFYKAY